MQHDPTVKDSPATGPRPLPLDYAKAAPSEVPAKVLAALSGGVMAMLIIGFCAAVVYPYPIEYQGSLAPRAKPIWWFVGVFLSLPIIALVLIRMLWKRRPLHYAGWFWLGFCIGIGLTGLLEGACYANP
jgi:hypothetical protein